jgi:hypothetical protein
MATSSKGDMKMTTLVQLSFYRDNENFQLSFDLKEESLGEIFDKLEIMLAALGFVLDGKILSLVDRDSDGASEIPEWESKFLAEIGGLTSRELGDKVPFTIHTGGKE